MNKTIKAFTLGLAGAATALALNLAAPVKAEAATAPCYYGDAGELLEEFWCDTTRRVNANGHIVYDVKGAATGDLLGTIVLWDDDTAEWIQEDGSVNPNFVTEDLDHGYIRLINADNDYNFVFQAR